MVPNVYYAVEQLFLLFLPILVDACRLLHVWVVVYTRTYSQLVITLADGEPTAVGPFQAFEFINYEWKYLIFSVEAVKLIGEMEK